MKTCRADSVTEKEPAAALGLDLVTFRSWVADGRPPKAVPDCGKFDMRAMDEAIDPVSGNGSPQQALDMWGAKGAGNARSA